MRIIRDAKYRFKKVSGLGENVLDKIRSQSFPIVGIVASPRELESIDAFFQRVPPNSEMAFILLANTDFGSLQESEKYLQHHLRIPLVEIKDGLEIQPNKVFYSSTRDSLKIINGQFNLVPRKRNRPTDSVVDVFLESLAVQAGRKGIAVVLAGANADGVQGLGAVKAYGGMALVQDPSYAKLKAMPQRCIDSKLADFILAPEKMAEEILALRQESGFVVNAFARGKATSQSLQQLYALICNQTQIDFGQYRTPVLKRRIQRRMLIKGQKSLASYLRFVESHPDEIKILADDFLVPTTEFFRDLDSFEILKQRVFPKLLKGRPKNSPIRVWVAGCATGEEVYSLAISLLEYLDAKESTCPIQVFGTDLSEKSIQSARMGRYSHSLELKFSPERLLRFFEKVDHGYEVRKFVRNCCLFSIHDVTRDPPFARLDIVSCRSLLSQFSEPLQKRVLPILHYSLRDHGFLWLGRKESLGEIAPLFGDISKIHGLFSKGGSRPLHSQSKSGSSVSLKMRSSGQLEQKSDKKRAFEAGRSLQSQLSLDIGIEVDAVLKDRFLPPCVVVNANLEIVQWRGACAPFIESPLSGHPSSQLLKMARLELLPALRQLSQAVKSENVLFRQKSLNFELEGVIRSVTIEALPVNPEDLPAQRFYMFVFKETSLIEATSEYETLKVPTKGLKRSKGSRTILKNSHLKIRELQRELADSQESQTILIEQYEATQEELKATNEEMQSASEEMQSTNEELETAKEELLSANEELVSVNEELHARNTELTSLGSDLNNLLDSTEIPIVMVGNDLRIRRFTSKARVAFNLLTTDLGRPLGHIRSKFNIDLVNLVTEVKNSLAAKELEIQDKKGAWCRLQIRPYRCVNNKNNGAVITLIDIEDLKIRERHSREAMEYAKSITETVPFPLLVMDGNYQVRSVNKAFNNQFQIHDEFRGQNLFSFLEIGAEYRIELGELMANTIKTDAPFSDFEIKLESMRMGTRHFLLSGRKISWLGLPQTAILLSLVDVTKQRKVESERQQALEREREYRSQAEKANQTKDIFLATLSHELRTPLSSILTWSHLIHSGKVDHASAKQGAAVIEQSAKTQSQLIDDLLDISRIIAGKLVMDTKQIDLSAVLLLAVESVRSMAEKKSMSIQTILPKDKAWVSADPVRMQQVVWNLLTNAIKFSPRGGSIEVRLDYLNLDNGGLGDTSSPLARIQVIDHGKGIPQDFLPRIFSRFSQADSASTRIHGGLGLGLSIVHNLVELHGGIIRAENMKGGQGAVFTILLPLCSTESISKSSALPISESKPEEVSLEGLETLLVEDDENTRDAISIILRSLGAQVRSADSVKVALDILRDFRPDIIVSDIAMPMEDGYSFISKIRKMSDEQGGAVRAVALTAYATAEDAARAMNFGFNAHVAKPVKDLDLAKAMLKVLGR